MRHETTASAFVPVPASSIHDPERHKPVRPQHFGRGMADRRALVVRCCVLAYANAYTGHPCELPATVRALNSGTVTELSLSPRDFGRKGPGRESSLYTWTPSAAQTDIPWWAADKILLQADMERMSLRLAC